MKSADFVDKKMCFVNNPISKALPTNTFNMLIIDIYIIGSTSRKAYPRRKSSVCILFLPEA